MDDIERVGFVVEPTNSGHRLTLLRDGKPVEHQWFSAVGQGSMRESLDAAVCYGCDWVRHGSDSRCYAWGAE